MEKHGKRLKSYFGSGLKIAIGNNVQDWRELFCSYESASYLMEQEFIFDHEDILTIDLICNLEGIHEAVTVEWMEMLIGVGGGGNIIRRVYYYMEKNYHKDLKLENISKNFNYNSAYLGKLFRKEMGETFNNSLDRIRITNARKLLEETDLKVYQISEQVGYSSIDYFYMKFKKYVGISPKEYRKNWNEFL